MNELIFLGILLSLLFTELTGVSPGGLIVPAYLYLYWDSPVRMMLTLVNALLCVLIVRGISRYTILYGRRRFAVYLLCGMALKALFSLPLFAGLPEASSLALSIGYVIPGLVGRDVEKQGVLKTFAALGIVVLLLRVAQIALEAAR